MLLDKYLACNPDEEVDHCVCMLFFHRLWEHGLCPWHGLAATKHLKKQNKTFIFKQAFFGCHFLHPKHTAANPQRKKKKRHKAWQRGTSSPWKLLRLLCGISWHLVQQHHFPGSSFFSHHCSLHLQLRLHSQTQAARPRQDRRRVKANLTWLHLRFIHMWAW